MESVKDKNIEKNVDYLSDETKANKSEKDYESVPSQEEKVNRKMNKRLNKIEELKDYETKNDTTSSQNTVEDKVKPNF